MNTSNWQLKTEREQVITERDALKIDLQSNTLSNTESLKTADRIDQINEQLEVSEVSK